MTELTKTVKRRTQNSRSNTGRAFVVELRPGAVDTIFIREDGKRSGYEVPVEKIWQLGARLEADRSRTQRFSQVAKKKKEQ